jgi:hypothetical protein
MYKYVYCLSVSLFSDIFSRMIKMQMSDCLEAASVFEHYMGTGESGESRQSSGTVWMVWKAVRDA